MLQHVSICSIIAPTHSNAVIRVTTMANKTGNGMEVVYTQLVYNRFRNFRVPERSKKKTENIVLSRWREA